MLFSMCSIKGSQPIQKRDMDMMDYGRGPELSNYIYFLPCGWEKAVFFLNECFY